ncbi:Protein of unknown function DUF4452 [Fusarium oxysporum f. sp. vasinfectum]|nr:Protein of unknown function DUF4452 [Fusarium oxysporum f. sp. vasinfectum]
MSAYYHYNAHPAHPAPVSHNHHGGRNRRAPRLSVSQQAQRQFRGVRSMKELNETASLTAFRTKFETSRSFDLEDDMEFCPGLLTETDPATLPTLPPTQHPNTVAPGFSLNSTSPAFIPPAYQQQPSMKLHQPSATRGRNAIPIINPATGITMSSPPQSVSPGRMQQSMRRW